MMTGATTYYDEKSNFYFRGKDKDYDSAYLNEAYEVYGYVLNEATHSFLNFKYQFAKLEDANSYFDQMKKDYHLIKIKIYKKNLAAV